MGCVVAVGALADACASRAWATQAGRRAPQRAVLFATTPAPQTTAPPPPTKILPQPGQQTPAPAAALPTTPVAFDVYRSGPQGFSVVLVLGDMQNTSTADSVPSAARKALADMKDFLPYKGYRLLDVQWTLCCGKHRVVSGLRGVEETQN